MGENPGGEQSRRSEPDWHGLPLLLLAAKQP
jgi:hypothetical protein